MNDFTLLGLEISGRIALLTLFIGVIALAANWRLFIKCNQPGWSIFVPGYNVIVAMRVIGRPDSHALMFLIPGFNIYFTFRTMIELAQAFGKRSTIDYLLVAVFNVFYVLNLGLAYQEEYQGPVYGSAPKASGSVKGGLATH